MSSMVFIIDPWAVWANGPTRMCPSPLHCLVAQDCLISFAQVGSTLVDMPLQCKAPQALGSKADSERLQEVRLLSEESSTLIINSHRRFKNKDWLEKEALRLEAAAELEAVKAVKEEAAAALAKADALPLITLKGVPATGVATHTAEAKAKTAVKAKAKPKKKGKAAAKGKAPVSAVVEAARRNAAVARQKYNDAQLEVDAILTNSRRPSDSSVYKLDEQSERNATKDCIKQWLHPMKVMLGLQHWHFEPLQPLRPIRQGEIRVKLKWTEMRLPQCRFTALPTCIAFRQL